MAAWTALPLGRQIRSKSLPREPHVCVSGLPRCPSQQVRRVVFNQRLRCRAQGGATQSEESEAPTQAPSASDTAVSTTAGEAGPVVEELPLGELKYEEPTPARRALTSWKLLWALPWRRFKKGSVLTLELGGEISEARQGRFGSANSVAQICSSLRKAAYDPRVTGVYLKLAPLAVGWGKLQEIRRYLEFFRASGKFTVAYMAQGGEKEYFLASACEDLYVPPTASFTMKGFKVAGTFVRGVLDKVGVQPELRRIGQYKSAGDQILRTDMSPAQREQLTALLDDIYAGFTETVAAARGKTAAQVGEMLDQAIYQMQDFKIGGWVTDLKYEDEIMEDLKERTGTKPDDDLKSVGLKKYSSVSVTAFGLYGRKRIAVLRTAGAIGVSSPAGGESITADAVIRQVRALRKDKKVAAVVLRIDSPGGDALASDLMWREIRQLAKAKPVIASMGDVAASGGYYMAMAANKIVAEPLTITGSIGVITGKFNLAEVYRRIGYAKEVISRGRYAELLDEQKAFSEDESALFDQVASCAYESFRNKAAESRGMAVEAMQAVAQGRVWSGSRALKQGLVDALGGLHRAVAIAKQAAGIDESEDVSVIEVSKARMSPLQLLTGGAATNLGVLQVLLQAFASPQPAGGLTVALGGTLLSGALQQVAAFPPAGRPQALLPDLQVEGVASAEALASVGGLQSVATLFDGPASELF